MYTSGSHATKAEDGEEEGRSRRHAQPHQIPIASSLKFPPRAMRTNYTLRLAVRGYKSRVESKGYCPRPSQSQSGTLCVHRTFEPGFDMGAPVRSGTGVVSWSQRPAQDAAASTHGRRSCWDGVRRCLGVYCKLADVGRPCFPGVIHPPSRRTCCRALYTADTHPTTVSVIQSSTFPLALPTLIAHGM